MATAALIFSVCFEMLARLGVLDWRGRELWLRPLLSGTARIAAPPGTVAVFVVLIGTTSFDGFSRGPTWTGLAPSRWPTSSPTCRR